MRADRIKKLVSEKWPQLTQLELEDESHQHAGRAGQESHFKLLVVSPDFTGLNRVQRQRQVNQLLQAEFEQGLHALSMRLLTPGEYAKQQSEFQSPDCQGGRSIN